MDFSREQIASVLAYDPKTGVFTHTTGKRSGRTAGYLNQLGYIQIGIFSRREYAHRLAWILMTGIPPAGYIDHIDGNPSNNSWANLRLATNKQNQENWAQRRVTKSGVRGVSWNGQTEKWFARIYHHGKRIHLGYFNDIDSACAARAEAERRLYTHAR